LARFEKNQSVSDTLVNAAIRRISSEVILSAQTTTATGFHRNGRVREDINLLEKKSLHVH
jgi:hypothetical protein